MKQRTMKKAGALLDAPMGLTSAGEVIINATHLTGTQDVAAVIARLIDKGHEVFIGVVVPSELRRELMRDIDDAGADIVGRIGVRVLRRRGRR